MGNITGAMVFQSAILTVVALVLASSSWAVTGDSLIAFASAGIAFASTVAAIFIPMARRGTLTGRHLLVGGVFYVLYLGLVGLAVAGGHRPAAATDPSLVRRGPDVMLGFVGRSTSR